MARLLAGSWREVPPPLALTAAELALVAPILHRTGCSGLAWRRLEATPLRDLPGAALLHDGFVYHTLRVKMLQGQLAPLVSALRDRGIGVILAKGWSVGRRYPLPGLRPYGDLDFLVAPARLAEAQKVLADWEGVPPSVEFHAGFNELADRTVEGLFRRSRIEELDGVPIRVFAPEDHLRLLTLHALEHGLARPFWLCDVALLLETLPDDFDWDLCMSGRRWEGEGVRCALGLVSELLDVDLERAGVPPRWREAPLPPWLVPAGREALGVTNHYMTSEDPEDLLMEPMALVGAARLRWANPIEATFRRRAPWNAFPREPIQAADFLLRGAGFALRTPAGLWGRIARTDGEDREDEE